MTAEEQYAELFKRIVIFVDTSQLSDFLLQYDAAQLNQEIQVERKCLGCFCPDCRWVEHDGLVHTTWLMLALSHMQFPAAMALMARGVTLARNDRLHDNFLHVSACQMFNNSQLIWSKDFYTEPEAYFIMDLNHFLQRESIAARQWFSTQNDVKLFFDCKLLALARRKVGKRPSDYHVGFWGFLCHLFVTLYNSNCPINKTFWPSDLSDLLRLLGGSSLALWLGKLEWTNRNPNVLPPLTDTGMALLPAGLPALVVACILWFVACDLYHDELVFVQSWVGTGSVTVDGVSLTETASSKLLLSHKGLWGSIYHVAERLHTSRRQVLDARMHLSSICD